MTQKQFERGLSAALIVIALAFFAVQAQAQVAATLIPQPKMQFLTDSGLVCSGCKVYTYGAGTTTPLATYTSASGAVTNANPVILDSAGRADIWFTNLAYKVILKTSADVQIWSVDNVSSFCTVTGCSMTGQLSITGALGISVVGSMITAGNYQTSSSSGVGLIGSSTSTSGSTIGVNATAASSSGTALQLWNSAAGGSAIVSYNAAGSGTPFRVLNTGAVTSGAITANGAITATSIAINGGTALTTTNQTGTGSIVMSAAPAITGNMTYASTTPVANLTTVPASYGITGVQQTGTHLVVGSCVLGTSCAVTLSGAAVFTSSSSYFCFAQDLSAAAATQTTYASGTSFTITGTGTDTIRFACTGN